MIKQALLMLLMAILVGCMTLFPVAPPRFPQFDERRIAGPGTYQIPQWSPDGRYLAFLDVSRDPILKVYDTEAKAIRNVATNVSSAHFSWKPNGDLTYLKYHPNLSGSPYPIISELHQVDLNGESDEVIAADLSNAGDFAWFSDGTQMVILLTEQGSRTYFNDVYILNVTTGITDIFLEAESIDLDFIVSLALSPDDKSLLIYGTREMNGPLSAQIVVFDLETQTIRNRIIPSQVVPSGNANYPWPGIGDSTNFGWVGGQQWFLASVNTPSGDCYNYALFFFDTHDLQSSFCIPTVEGVFDFPAISPDLSKISYVTVVGPGEYYVMIGNVTSDLLDRMELGGE